jgi:hypothetical protein
MFARWEVSSLQTLGRFARYGGMAIGVAGSQFPQRASSFRRHSRTSFGESVVIGEQWADRSVDLWITA